MAHNQTLILPEGFPVTSEFKDVGRLIRREADVLIVGYTFDLRNNNLKPETVSNPSAGREHVFHAWRVGKKMGEPVLMLKNPTVAAESHDDLDTE